MNGIHDLGGMHGFGPVVPEPDEPVFHAEWERRAFALTLAMGAWPAAPGAGREPGRGAEDAAGMQAGALPADAVARFLRHRRGARRGEPVASRFRPGDRVLARNVHPVGHTRIPRYVRGRHGLVDRDHGVFVFPDTHALGLGQKPQHVYSVRFDARELWGPRRRGPRSRVRRPVGRLPGRRVSAPTPPLSGLPRDEDGPVFREPWEAQAFAMAVRLHEAGCFTWTEWAGHLAAEIERARATGDPDLGSTYYHHWHHWHHWLAALERIVAEKGLLTPEQLVARQAEWDAAARSTPHGNPIELPKR